MVSFASERLSELHEEFSSRIKPFTQSSKYRHESDTVSQSSQGVSGVSPQVSLVSSLASQSSASASQSESVPYTQTIDEGEQSGNLLSLGVTRHLQISTGSYFV